MKKMFILKVVIIIAIISILAILIILNFSTEVVENVENETVIEPEEEISEEQMRQTAITLYFEDKESMQLVTEEKKVDAKDLVDNPYLYIVNLLNRPIEKAIRRRFCRLAHRKLKEIPGLKVIGITGSYGKTSTKYIVNTILSQKYNTLMTPESYNTTMGVVRTINEKLSSTHQLFICEMGAKYIGDIKEICDIVDPNYRYFNSYRATAFRYF